jgi:beta-glucosidase
MNAMSVPANLIERMTLAEKIGQLTMVAAGYAVTGPTVSHDIDRALREGRIGSLLNLFGIEATRAVQRVAVEETRLKIPLFFGFDTIHGFRTVFPIPIAEAGAFDPGLWEETAHEAAAESIAAGLDLTFTPMLDIARDPRWGRMAEGPGEDPVVASRFAEAKVRGLQGQGLTGIAATAKHFVAYGAALAGRDYAEVDISDRLLHEVYLPPFRAAVDAGVAAVMPSFNDIAGLPMTAHRGLLTQTLREIWGFSGVIVSDYNAIAELIRHGVAADLAEAAALALKAGVDIDMMAYAYEKGLPEALTRGLVRMEDVDAAVLRVLAFKDRLGLFDDPYRRRSPSAVDAPVITDRARARARTAAGRSLVLLKNTPAVLPLPSQPGRIAIIGPLADAGREMIGPWSGAGRGEEAVSVLAGLRAALPDVHIDHVAGVPLVGGDTSGIATAVEAATKADHVILCLGEAAAMSGEAASRARIDLPGHQAELADAILATGKPVAVLLFSGRPIAMADVFERAAAVVACWFPGTEAGTAIADVLAGHVNPSAKLAITWPRHVGQVPIFYGARPSGRPMNPLDKYTSKYLDMPNDPQFPFGHGLSYTAFSLTDPRVTSGETITVETSVSNEGARAGRTTVFLFIRDPVASLSRPVLELKRFETVALEAGERRVVGFRLTRNDFAFLDLTLEPLVESGEIEIHVGLSADRSGLKSAELRLDVPPLPA